MDQVLPVASFYRAQELRMHSKGWEKNKKDVRDNVCGPKILPSCPLQKTFANLRVNE